MTTLTLDLDLAIALDDRLDAARRDGYGPALAYACAGIALAAALRERVATGSRTVTVTLTEDEASAAMRAAILYGTGRPV